MVNYRGAEAAWTPARVQQLRDLIARGLSTARIAQELGDGITRNAVIGKARRMGIPLNSISRAGIPQGPRASRLRVDRGERAPIERKGPFKKNAARFARELNATPLPAGPDFVAPALEPAPVEDHAIPLEQRCTLLTLKPTSCRWPVGDPIRDPNNFFFCGAVRAEKSSYCPHHDRRSKP